MRDVCRIEKWMKDPDGKVTVGEYDTVYYLVTNGNRRFWYDEDLEPISNPLAFKGYNLKEFYKCVAETWKHDNGILYELKYYGTYDGSDYAYDIIFKEEGVMPYNKYMGTDIRTELIEKSKNREKKMDDTTKIRMIKNIISEYHNTQGFSDEKTAQETINNIERIARQ